jgi:hypothetical protein
MNCNVQKTVTDCFYIRDHRHGRGERDLGRMCFNWLADYHPVLFLKLFHHIPEYGRWDDLLYITNSYIRPYIYNFLAIQINTDYFNMTIGKPITTCAKWMPSEGKSFARHHKQQFTQLLQHMKMTPKEYRVRISVLRKYLNIPEHYLCTGKIHLLNKNKLTTGFKKKYQAALHKKDAWTFPMTENKTIKKSKQRIKNDDKYIPLLNHLKVEN